MAGHSKVAITAAIVANSVVAVAKLSGAWFTGSGALLAEGIHSVADVGNQSLLAIGLSKSQKKPTRDHPFGFGREAFIWGLISAVGVFFLGCGVTIMHGVHSLQSSEHHVSNLSLAIGIMIFSLVIEGISLAIAMRGTLLEAKAHEQSFFAYLRSTDNPFTIAILLEDSAAVLGVIIALGAVWLTQATHMASWDAWGSIIIGILLGGVALFLIWKNRSFLIGRSISSSDWQRINTILTQDPIIESVSQQKAEVTGAQSFTLSAELDFDGRVLADRYLQSQNPQALMSKLQSEDDLRLFLQEYSEGLMTQLGVEINRIEAQIRKEVPKADTIALEPD